VFKSTKSEPQKVAKKATPTRDTAVTILTSSCHFSGKLYCRGASRIGGKIEGQIISEGLLIIEEEAVITAEIKADEAIIQGRVEGKLQATSRVELCASSRFDGDIVTPVLIVREGAQFNGHSTMVKAEEAAQTTKGPRIVGSGKDKDKDRSNGKHDPRLPDIGGDIKQADVGMMKGPEVRVSNN
jgi:cytoskeletal protein CcmA (bactofilin family)